MSRTVIEFSPFRLDLCDERLWRGEQAIHLRPKTFAVLRHLAERPGRLVTKAELVSAIWAGTAVTEDTLTRSIRELRAVLGDDARAARFIETVHRRGFRWIAASRALPEGPSVLRALPGEQAEAPPPFVGRAAEMALLDGAFAAAAGGDRRLVFLTGEAGIGKTAVADAFLRRLSAAPPDERPGIGRGQCIQHHGPAEAYMPVLEALADLAGHPNGPHAATLLRRHAPTWLAQLPSLVDPAEREALQRVAAGGTRERMLREFAAAIAALAAEAPVVLVLEDLHWSDHATSDLLALVGRRREPARLLVIGTVRPVELLVHGHPLTDVQGELVRQGHADDVILEPLDPDAVAAYLAARFAPHDFPEAFARLLCTRTDGHPFFLVAALDDLVRQGALVDAGGRWSLAVHPDRVAATVPPSVRDMVERQLAALDDEERALLEAASVAGCEFTAPAIAAAVGCEVERAETRCAALARRQQLIEAAGATRWPDGTPAARFRFRHALPQTVVYDRIGAGRRARLHRCIAERLEAGFGPRASDVAAELAAHFEQGGDARRAVAWVTKVARRALRRGAPHEATRAFARAMALTAALPAGPDRERDVLTLTLAHANAQQIACGYGSDAAESAFARARTLAEALDALPEQFMALAGLFAFDLTRCRLAEAHDDAARMLALADRMPAPIVGLMANTFAGMTHYLAGEFVVARRHLETAVAFEAEQPPGVDTNFTVMALSHLACVLALLGHPDEARRTDARARARARDTGHHDEAVATFCSAALGAMLHDTAWAARASADGLALTETHGFPMWRPSSQVVHGWARAVDARDPAGVAEARAGLAGLDAVGFERDRTFHLLLVAGALVAAGEAAPARTTVEVALERAAQTGERCCLPELWRLAGELGARDPGGVAEQCFERAVELACAQEARWWELRATTSLARLWREHGRAGDARRALRAVLRHVTGGDDTVDVREARALAAR